MAVRPKLPQWKRVRASHGPNGRIAWGLGGLAVLLLLLPCGVARALDTTETFDRGFVDAEAYWGYDGLGHTREARELSNQLVLGYGLFSRISIHGGASFAGQQSYFTGQKSLSLGIFGTPIDTDHFDLDLMLDLGASGDGLADFSLAPGFEAIMTASPT